MTGAITVTRKNGTSFSVPRSRKPRKPRATKALRAVVNKIVHGAQETKYVIDAPTVPNYSSDLTTFTAFSSAVTSTAEIYAGIPELYPGSGSYERAGDMIQPMKAYTEFNVTLSTDNDIASDRTVHVYMLEAVAVKALANYTAIPITLLLDNGQGGAGGFNGQTNAALYNVNGKLFRLIKHVKKRLVKGFGKVLGGTGATAGGTTAVVCPTQTFHNFRIHHKRLPKTLKYENAGEYYPTNFAPFFVIGYTMNFGGGDTASNLVDVMVEARNHMWYKDS